RRPRSTRPVATVPTIRSARAPPPRSEPGVPLPAGEGCHRAQARRPLACGPRCDEDPCSAARLGGRAHASGPTLHSGRNSADTLVVRSVPGAGRGRRVVPGTEVPLTGPLSCLRSASTTRRIPSGRRRSSTPPTRAASTSSSSAVRQDRAHVLAIRWRAVLACAVLILAAAGPAVADDEALWTLLRAGGQVIMLRHAGTIGTFGDPPGFRFDDCSTQRNLTEAGREQARKIGEAFRAREIPIARVLSSPWCRCLDTARLAFGRVE